MPVVKRAYHHCTDAKKCKTINSRYSLVVTDPTTNLSLIGLSTGDRTGTPVFRKVWSIAKNKRNYINNNLSHSVAAGQLVAYPFVIFLAAIIRRLEAYGLGASRAAIITARKLSSPHGSETCSADLRKQVDTNKRLGEFTTTELNPSTLPARFADVDPCLGAQSVDHISNGVTALASRMNARLSEPLSSTAPSC